MNRKLSLNFRKLSDPDVYGMAMRVVLKLTNNENFPDAAPFLPPIQTTATQFLKALNNASLGDMYYILAKNELKEKLIAELRELAEWIEKRSTVIDTPNGIELALLSTGFMLAKPPRDAKLQAPEDFRIIPGKKNGEIIMQIKRVKGAKAYMFQYARDPLTNESQWETITSTQRKKVIANLPLGVKFLFRIAAIGARNQVVYTNVLGRHVA
jgi:hypothetical protein